MAEPKHAGHDKTDRQRDDRLCVSIHKLHPGRRVREPAGLRQILASNVIATPKMVLLNASNRRISKRPICFNLAPPSKPPDTRPGHAFSCWIVRHRLPLVGEIRSVATLL